MKARLEDFGVPAFMGDMELVLTSDGFRVVRTLLLAVLPGTAVATSEACSMVKGWKGVFSSRGAVFARSEEGPVFVAGEDMVGGIEGLWLEMFLGMGVGIVG